MKVMTDTCIINGRNRFDKKVYKADEAGLYDSMYCSKKYKRIEKGEQHEHK